MKALILNSGIGKRMGNLTKDKPKCLVEINNEKTILSYEIKSLYKVGINDFLITTGPFEDKLIKYVQKKFPGLHVTFINNPKYDSTNYIYSIYLTKEILDDDILLMHGDMIYNNKVLNKLLEAPYENAVLADSQIELPEKDFKARLKNGNVVEIGVNVFGNDCVFLAPIYKLKQDFIQLWLEEIEKFINNGEDGVYAENAFNKIADKLLLKPVYYNGLFCTEIDNIKDLELVKKNFK